MMYSVVSCSILLEIFEAFLLQKISLFIACSRHAYIVFFFARILFVVNHTINATPQKRLQQYNDQKTFYLFSSLRPAQDKSAFQNIFNHPGANSHCYAFSCIAFIIVPA